MSVLFSNCAVARAHQFPRETQVSNLKAVGCWKLQEHNGFADALSPFARFSQRHFFAAVLQAYRNTTHKGSLIYLRENITFMSERDAEPLSAMALSSCRVPMPLLGALPVSHGMSQAADHNLQMPETKTKEVAIWRAVSA
jgi:hypothetical protein